MHPIAIVFSFLLGCCAVLILPPSTRSSLYSVTNWQPSYEPPVNSTTLADLLDPNGILYRWCPPARGCGWIWGPNCKRSQPLHCPCFVSGSELMYKKRPKQPDGTKLAIIAHGVGCEETLRTFVHVTHAYLADQIFPFRIFVIEQNDVSSTKPLNRGALLNIGFEVARHDSDYVCFYDASIVPADPTADFTKPGDVIRKVAIYVQNNGYVAQSDSLGSVWCSSKENVIAMDGFSTGYAGDNEGVEKDMLRRAHNANITVISPMDSPPFWSLMPPVKRTASSAPREHTGLSTMKDTYRITKKEEGPLLHKRIYVDLL